MQCINLTPLNLTQNLQQQPTTTTPVVSKMIHLRIQKRTGNSCLTLIDGLPEHVNVKQFTQNVRKMFHCSCTEIEHPKFGRCIQVSGDFRNEVKNLLIKEKFVSNEKEIKIHGY